MSVAGRGGTLHGLRRSPFIFIFCHGLLGIVATISLLLVAACEGLGRLTGASEVSRHPGMTLPNEPPGLKLVTDWGMDEDVPTEGDVDIPGSPDWSVVSNKAPGSLRGWAHRVSDPSAPVSPASVYEFVYPEGMVEGDAPATVYYDDLDASEIFVGFWWKASSPFDFGPNGNKIAFIFNGGGHAGGQQFLILKDDLRLHVLPEYPGDYRWRTPNVNATAVTLGRWHRIEWHAATSGTLKWWLDGVLQGNYTDVRNPHEFDMFQFSPTWGGNIGARKRQTDRYWFDHVQVSVR
jgi:hypothetical protein